MLVLIKLEGTSSEHWKEMTSEGVKCQRSLDHGALFVQCNQQHVSPSGANRKANNNKCTRS